MREDDKENEKKRHAVPETNGAPGSLQLHSLRRWETYAPTPTSSEDIDDFDWPEFIDG